MAAQPKKKVRVLLSGAGGAGTIAVIKHLRAAGNYWVAAMDMDKFSAGLYMADHGIVVPAVTNPDYFNIVKKFIVRSGIDVYIPLIDEELLGAQSLADALPGLKVITPRGEFISLVLNKYRMTEAFAQRQILCPKTFLIEDVHRISFSKPMIVKPITGRGSRGVVKVISRKDVRDYFKSQRYKPDEILIQEFIEGDEYTVSAVVGRSGHMYAVVPKKIIHKQGITHRSVTVRHPGIERMVNKIQEEFHADGPFNVQLRVRAGKLYVLEVNPRFSTTVAHTMAAGVDEVGLLIRDFREGLTAPRKLIFKENLLMLRHMTQHYVPWGQLK